MYTVAILDIVMYIGGSFVLSLCRMVFPHILQVLDPELDLRTVKYFIWKSSGDVKLVYREKVDPSVLEEAPLNGEKTEQLASND